MKSGNFSAEVWQLLTRCFITRRVEIFAPAVHLAKWTRPSRQEDAWTCTPPRIRQKNHSRVIDKLLQRTCPTSLQKSAKFSCVFFRPLTLRLFFLLFVRYFQLFYNFARRKVIFNSLGGGTFVLYRKQTKRYALLLQVENLGNFHHCIESPETCNNGSEKDEDRHDGFTR